MAYGTLNAGAITPGSGNTLTLSESIALGTVTSGTIGSGVTFPAGHLIKKTFLINAESGDVGGNNSTPQSYVSGDYTTLLASSASYLEIVYYSTASTKFSGYGTQNYYITATTGSHTTTYGAGNLIRLTASTTIGYRREIAGATALWDSFHFLQYFGADPYPNTDSITSWSAGDVLRFQIYGSSDSVSGDVQLAKDTYWRGFWVNEYKI